MCLSYACFPVSAEERRAREWPLDVVELPEGHLEDWLEKRAKRLSSAPSSRYRPLGSLPPMPSGRTSLPSPEAELPCPGPDKDAPTELLRGASLGVLGPQALARG